MRNSITVNSSSGRNGRIYLPGALAEAVERVKVQGFVKNGGLRGSEERLRELAIQADWDSDYTPQTQHQPPT